MKLTLKIREKHSFQRKILCIFLRKLLYFRSLRKYYTFLEWNRQQTKTSDSTEILKNILCMFALSFLVLSPS